MRHGARVEEDTLHDHHARRHGVAAVRLVARLYPALRAARVDHLPPAAPEPEPLQSLGRHPDAVDLVRAAQRNVSLRHPRKLDEGSLRSARDLGASGGVILRDIVLPLIRPATLVCLLLSFVRSLADFGTPIIIGGRFSTLAADIYLQVVGYSDLESPRQ